jgi:hypothetical protein
MNVHSALTIANKRKILGILFAIIVLFSYQCSTANAQSSVQANFLSSGVIIVSEPTPTPTVTPTSTPTPTPTPSPTLTPTPTPAPTNLAVLPGDWTLTFGTNPQYAFLDNTVTHNGHVSIRIGPDNVGATREIDGKWYSVKPGDRIVAKVWILAGNSNTGDTTTWHGGRLGLDLWAHTSAGYGIVDSFPHDGQEHINSVVQWGTNVWIQKVWDITVPSTYYTQMHTGNLVMKSCNPVQIDSFVIWLDVRTTTDTGLVWFSDTELYINP